MDKNKSDYLIIIFLTAISSAVIFNNIEITSMDSWDEARHAQNALELLRTGDWVVLRYNGEPDMWNLKPPLGAWLIAISFKIFGISEFALRFWSAVSAVGTIIVVYLLGSEMGNRYTGLFAAMILLTTNGFIGYHAARTGDYDTPLAFFITLAIYFFYLSQVRKKSHYLVPTAIATALGVMVKGVVGLAPLPIALIYLLYSKNLKKTLASKDIIHATASFIAIVSPWIILRLLRGGEFFSKMIQNDLLKRFSEPIEGHVGSSTYYITTLENGLETGWFIFLAVAFAYSLYLLNKRDKRGKQVSLLVIWISLFVVIFTLAETKIVWYMVPVYPAISILISYYLGGYAIDITKKQDLEKVAILMIFLIFLAQSFLSVLEITQNPAIKPRVESTKEFKNELRNVNNIYFKTTEDRRNWQSILFYLSLYVNGSVRSYENLKWVNVTKNDAIITVNPDTANVLNANKDYVLVKRTEYLSLFRRRD